MSGQTIGAMATAQNSTTMPVRTRSWNISGVACSAAPSQTRNLGVRLKTRSAKTAPSQHSAHMNFQLILIAFDRAKARSPHQAADGRAHAKQKLGAGGSFAEVVLGRPVRHDTPVWDPMINWRAMRNGNSCMST